MGYWRKFKKTQGNIAFHDDVILKAHERVPRFTPWQYNVALKFLIPQIKMAIKNPRQLSINCGRLGIFHFKAAYAGRKVEIFKNYVKKDENCSRRFRERTEILEAQVNNFLEKYERVKAKSDKYVMTAHINRRVFSRRSYGRFMNLEQLELYMRNLDETRRQAN
jgi:hypothetical protein